jgi:hypothetical protein
MSLRQSSLFHSPQSYSGVKKRWKKYLLLYWFSILSGSYIKECHEMSGNCVQLLKWKCMKSEINFYIMNIISFR